MTSCGIGVFVGVSGGCSCRRHHQQLSQVAQDGENLQKEQGEAYVCCVPFRPCLLSGLTSTGGGFSAQPMKSVLELLTHYFYRETKGDAKDSSTTAKHTKGTL